MNNAIQQAVDAQRIKGHANNVSYQEPKSKKCALNILEQLNDAAERLSTLVNNLEGTFGPVLRNEVLNGEANGPATRESMPEFFESLHQRVNSLGYNMDRIQSILDRSEL